MTTGLTIKNAAPFAALIRSLDAAIRMRSIYPAGHPTHADSVKNTKSALDAWFRLGSKFELGFSPKNLVLEGELIKENNPAFAAMADYFHSRGVQALSIARSVAEAELTTLLDSLSGSPEAIAEAGGIVPQLRACTHITVKEIDYRAVLAASRRNAAADPIRLWESLCRMVEAEHPAGDSVAAMAKDPAKTAAACNAAFAGADRNRDAMLAKLRKVLNAIGQESAKASRDRSVRESFAAIAAKLNPELLVNLLAEGGDATGASALQETLLRELPENTVADLIVSMIDRQGKIDRNLIDLFGKLSRKTSKLSDVASLVADRLRQSGESAGDGLAGVREAIREALKVAPRDDFMSKVYKLTVDTVSERIKPAKGLAAPLKALVDAFEDRMQPANAALDKVELLLNVLWFESDPVHFKKLSESLLEALRNCPAERVHALARDALKLYSEKLGAAADLEDIAREAEPALRQVGKLAGAPFLASLIPGANEVLLRGLGCAFAGADAHSADVLLDAFLKEHSPAGKHRYATILSGFTFTTRQMRRVVAALRQSHDHRSRDIMLGVLLQNCGEREAEELFALLDKRLSVSEHARSAVRICGERRLTGMVPHLAKILDVRPRLDWRGYGALRTAAALSLLQIDTPEARRILEHHENNKDRAVRQACEKVLGKTSG